MMNLEKDKVKEFEDGDDGDAEGEPVDAAKVGQEHLPGVTEIQFNIFKIICKDIQERYTAKIYSKDI